MAPRNARYLRPLSVAVDEAGTNYSIFTKELYRAIRNAILELRAHGAVRRTPTTTFASLSVLTEEETQRSETTVIPD